VSPRRTSGIVAEVLLWVLAVGLLSPLAIYAGTEVMPLAGLFAVAAGIALALALSGRQLHDALLSEAMSGRKKTARIALGAGMMLLAVLLVLLGLVVGILLLVRGPGQISPIL